jgi:hypothetical protein
LLGCRGDSLCRALDLSSDFPLFLLGSVTSIMQLPVFLKRDPTEGLEFLDDRASRGFATRGWIIGCFAALLIWFIPIPVAIVFWLFDIRGPFGDTMLMSIPFLLALPIIGAGIAEMIRRRVGANSSSR